MCINLPHISYHSDVEFPGGIELFFRRLKTLGICDLIDVEPKHITTFLSWMNDQHYGVSTIRLYLFAVRMFLDHCVVNGLISVNPAKAIKLPKYLSHTGKTPVIVPEQVRQIIDTIPLKTQADYRDRAPIGLMVFSFFRVSAALSLSLKDYELRGPHHWIIGEGKGSKRHEMPVHPTLKSLLGPVATNVP